MENRGNLDVLAEYSKDGSNYTALVGVPEWQPNKQYFPNNMVKYLIGGVWKTFTAIVSNNNSDPNSLNNTNVWEQQSKTILEIRGSIGVDPTTPLGYNNSTGVISMSQATSGSNGYLTSVDWLYFDQKVNSFDINQPGGVPGISLDRKVQLLSATGTQISNLINYNTVPRDYNLPDRDLILGNMYEWTPNTNYEIGARVSYQDIFYKAVTPHTSSTLSFANDYDSGIWKKISYSRSSNNFILPNSTEYDLEINPIGIDIAVGRYDVTLDDEFFYFFLKYDDFSLPINESDYLDIYIRNGIDLLSQIKDTSNRLNVYVNKLDETIYIQNLTGSVISEVNIKFTPKRL